MERDCGGLAPSSAHRLRHPASARQQPDAGLEPGTRSRGGGSWGPRRAVLARRGERGARSEHRARAVHLARRFPGCCREGPRLPFRKGMAEARSPQDGLGH